MAVFLSNVCTFNSCGRKFASLQELIRHIEENHSYDYEQEAAIAETSNFNTLIPISCILRIFSNRSADADSSDRKTIDSLGASQSLGSTPTDGSEFDEDADSDSGQSSIDSWATANADASLNPLNKYHQIMGSSASSVSGNLDENNNSTKLNGAAKEYICGFSGCTKRYQSSNSLSHHRRSVHKTMCINGSASTPIAKPVIDEKEKKIFPCTMCSKVYKTSHGLKNHNNLQHNRENALNRPASLQQVNGTGNGSCNATSLAMTSNGIQQIKHEMPAQVTSFVQISTTPNTSIKTEISPSVKETLLNSLQNSINKSKGITNSLVNGKFIKLESSGNGTTTFPLSAELISDGNGLPTVGNNVEVSMSDSKMTHITIKSPPIISAPTLQQHLLSPIIPKVASS
ncbi:hypothetical protein TYRP_008463 [Tyrophagus putrescentiae]|nr:hypothetical protein TYRP_008463 [Tyrophagus putrescentiae]